MKKLLFSIIFLLLPTLVLADPIVGLPPSNFSIVPFLAPGGSTARTPIARAYDSGVSILDYGAIGNAQRQSCPATIQNGQNVLTVGSPCSFAAAPNGATQYIDIQYAGPLLSTGPISVLPVTANGSAYTTIPTVNLSSVGTGLGAVSQVNMEMATATVATGGSECDAGGSGTFSFLVSGGTNTTQAVVTGTVTSGVLGGSLTVSTPGSYSALPSTSGATLTSGGSSPTTCSTYPTIGNTWSVLNVGVTYTGSAYALTTTAAFSAGNATLGTPTIIPVATPLATTITTINSPTQITLGANASQTLSAQTVYITWGVDDSTAINNAITAAQTYDSYVSVPPSPLGFYNHYYGVASPIVMNPNGLAVKIQGPGQYINGIIALSNMTAVLFEGTRYTFGGTIRDMQFDGNTLSPIAYFSCAERIQLDRDNFLNGPQYGTAFTLGDGVTAGCNESHIGDGTIVHNMGVFYSGMSDLPLIAAQVNETDSYWTNFVAVNGTQYLFYQASGAFNTYLTNLHVWASAGSYPAIAYSLNSSGRHLNITCDGFQNLCIDLAGGDTTILGGSLENPSSTLSSGIKIEANVSGCTVGGFDYQQKISAANILTMVTPLGSPACSIFAIPGLTNPLNPLPIYPALDNSSIALGGGALANWGGTAGNNTGIGSNALNQEVSGLSNVGVGHDACQNATNNSNTCIGAFNGLNISSGTLNTFVGESTGEGVSSPRLTGASNTAIGTGSLFVIQGTASFNSVIGTSTGDKITTGSNNDLWGYQVASTTLTTGARNILIGTAINCDTVASGTNDFFAICQSSGTTGASFAFQGVLAAGVGAYLGPSSGIGWADKSYTYQTETSGFSLTLVCNAQHNIIDPSATLAAGTITMCPAPTDGQTSVIKTSQTISALTLSANSGQSILGTPTTLALGGSIECLYRASNTTWYC